MSGRYPQAPVALVAISGERTDPVPPPCFDLVVGVARLSVSAGAEV
jgi:hypothetical protein